MKFSPIDDFLGAQRSVETSDEACRARCARDSQCAFFSFWEKELPDDNGCTLFDSTATLVRENETGLYITGPATCPGKLFFLHSHMLAIPLSFSSSKSKEGFHCHNMEMSLSFVDFEEPTGCQSSDGCSCSPQLPCGLGEGGFQHHHHLFPGEGGHHHCHLHHLRHNHAHLVLGEGDCDSKEDCQGNLVCGKDNCEREWFDEDDDCCADIGSYRKIGSHQKSKKEEEERILVVSISTFKLRKAENGTELSRVF